jgi:hypothetical protein
MVKSGAPIFVLIFAFITGIEKPSYKYLILIFRLTGTIAIIVFGVILMVADEAKFQLLGYIEVQLATILTGLRWSFTQLLLHHNSIESPTSKRSNTHRTNNALLIMYRLSPLVFFVNSRAH